MFILTIKIKFDAAHFLPNMGKCANLHGHTWLVEVQLQYSKTDEKGICEDFGKIKKNLRTCLPDHQNLNQVYDFNPTAENLARHFYDQFRALYDLPVHSITVWEAEDAGATYVEN